MLARICGAVSTKPPSIRTCPAGVVIRNEVMSLAPTYQMFPMILNGSTGRFHSLCSAVACPRAAGAIAKAQARPSTPAIPPQRLPDRTLI